MRSMTYRLLHEMMQEKNQNIFLSPVWILKTGIVSELEKYFIKVYFFANEDRLDIKELYFKLQYNGHDYNLVSREFVRADTYKNDKVFGCILPFQTEYAGEEYSILFTGVKIGDIVYDYSNHERGEVFFDVYIPNEINKFLKENIPYYFQFPRKGEAYWQCTCGQHNPNNAKNCYECFKEKNVIDELLLDGIDKVFLTYYVLTNPFEFNPIMSLQDTYDEYTKNISQKFSINIDYVREFVKYESIVENESKMIKEYNDQIQRSKKEVIVEIKQKTITVISILSAVVSLFLITVFGPQSINYMLGYYHLTLKEYSSSLDRLSPINGFLNSEDLINEVYYQWSNDLREKNVSKSISILAQISDINYKDAKNQLMILAEQYGIELYESKQYKEAIHYLSYSNRVDEYLNESKYLYLMNHDFDINDTYELTLLEELVANQYKDSQGWLERLYYEGALNAIEYDFFDKAILLLDKTSYSDAKSTQINLIKDKVDVLLSKGKYEESLTYVERLKDEPQGKELYQEVIYRLADKYEKEQDLEEALKHYRSILGFKDTNKRIKNLETSITQWETAIRFTNSEGQVINKTDVNSTLKIEIEFNTSGVDTNIIPRIIYIFPDGQKEVEIYESIVENGETLEFEFTDGLYEDSSFGPKGSFTIEIYYIGLVDILIGSKTIEVTN